MWGHSQKLQIQMNLIQMMVWFPSKFPYYFILIQQKTWPPWGILVSGTLKIFSKTTRQPYDSSPSFDRNWLKAQLIRFLLCIAIEQIDGRKVVGEKSLENTKGVIRIRISKNRQHNDQKKKYKTLKAFWKGQTTIYKTYTYRTTKQSPEA